MDMIATNLVALAVLKATLGGILEDNGKPVPTYFPDYVTAIQSAGNFQNRQATTTIEGQVTPSKVASKKRAGWIVSNKIYLPDATSIPDRCFEHRVELEEVIAPNVTSVGAYAFNGCRSLKTLVLSDSVSSIGTKAFCECSQLRGAINAPGVTAVPESAFEGCGRLQSIKLSPNLTTIGKYAFRNCHSLVHTNKYQNLVSVGMKAFDGCNNLSGFPVGKINQCTIGLEAFKDCKVSMSNYSDESELELRADKLNYGSFRGATFDGFSYSWLFLYGLPSVIPDQCFKNTKGARQTNLLLSDFSEIRSEAFRNSQSVSTIEGDHCNQNIILRGSAFRGCPNLRTVEQAYKVVSVEDFCFSGCPKLSKVELPDATDIGLGAFCKCTNLTSLVLTSCTDFGTSSSDAYATAEYLQLSCLGGPFSPNYMMPHSEFVFPYGKRAGQYSGPAGKIPLTSLTLPAVQKIGANCFGDATNYQFTDIMDLYLPNLTTAQIKAMDTYPYWFLHPSCTIHASDGNFTYGN